MIRRIAHIPILLLLLVFIGMGFAGNVSNNVKAEDRPVIVASKKFTESVILGEIAAQFIGDDPAITSEHRS